MKEERTFTFYWLDGHKDVSDGYNVADAFSNLGYSGGAISALDFYREGNDDNDGYYFDKDEGTWMFKDTTEESNVRDKN